MKKEFVPYEIALALKELGFDEECLKEYNKYKELSYGIGSGVPFRHKPALTAPLYQQAFRWFREKYKNLHGSIEQTNSYKDEYTVYIGRFGYIEGNLKDEPKVFISYEEAELECLKKLIEIVKNGKK